MPKLLAPQQPQSNAAMWIAPCRAKSLALLPALLLSFVAFVIAAGEAGADEQMVLPTSQQPQWCETPPDAAPPGTAPCPPTDIPVALDASPAGTAANGTPQARPFPTPVGSVPLAPGYELPPGPHVLPSPGADPGLEPEPTRPHHSPPPNTLSKPSDRHGPATSPTDQPRPKVTPEEALPVPGSATEPKPAFHAPQKEGLAGLQPPSAPDTLSAAESVPTSPNSPVGSPGEHKPSAAERTSDPVPSQVQEESEAAPSTVLQVFEPLVHEALPNFAAASRDVVEAVAQADETVFETLASALNALESWTAGWLPSGEAAQSSSDGTARDPLVPLIPPMPSPGDSSFFSLSGVGQAGPGGGLALLLLGVLASVLILRRRDGPLSWISYELPKPTSALLLPLERPG